MISLEELRVALEARGGQADVWLVYAEDAYESIVETEAVLKLQRAFWTQGEAYAFAHGAHEKRRWQHFYIFRLRAEVTWLEIKGPRLAQFETAFGRSRGPDPVPVLPMALAEALDR